MLQAHFLLLHIAVRRYELECIEIYWLCILLAKCTLKILFFQSAFNVGIENRPMARLCDTIF